MQNRNRVTDVENLTVTKREGGVRDKLEIKMDICTVLYIKQITNKDLIHNTENSTQYSVMTYMGKVS